MIKIAPGFIFPNSAGPIMWRVSGVSGTWMETASTREQQFAEVVRTAQDLDAEAGGLVGGGPWRVYPDDVQAKWLAQLGEPAAARPEADQAQR